MTKKNVFSSDAGLRRIKAPSDGRVVYRDTNMPGLTVNVSFSGVMVWYGIVKNHQGKTERQKLGNYLAGSEDGVSLERARLIVESARHRARAGFPPWEEFRGDGDNTFMAVRERFLKQYVRRNLKPNTQKAYQLALESADLVGWESRKVTELARKDVLAVLDGIADRGALVQANRMLAYLKKFFNWCAEKDVIRDGQSLPTDRVKPPLKKEKPRDRVLTEDEIRLVWAAAGELNSPFADVIRLMLLTGQRKQEIAGMRWADLDISAGLWTQRENKASRGHVVPLTKLAKDIINAAPRLPVRNRTLVFTTTGDTPPSGFSKAKRNLDNRIKVILAERDDGGEVLFLESWQFHDLRRTVTTFMRRLSIPQHVCARILSHAEKGVTGQVYDQYDMLAEKTSALEAWGRYLESLVLGVHQTENVVPFRKAEDEGVATPSSS
ncbi:MAG: tyrosine-type recombinase/integrase [Zhongshania sp.]|uniref:tyrosine-type recombinase/integrase n=1 Tax=Zhongshania sp. TaxID=1971902 RepID=UPI00263512B7|nr:tyrosine-type recombinase/integrase [Zhongshania sp.]MDF1692960.1 tyrosine-type recombinase/integrase [Zhongshania sp.]